MESKIEVNISNPKELAIFLRKNLTSQQIASKGLESLIPFKEKKRKGDKTSSYPWIFPKDSYLKSELKIMFAEALSVAVKVAMESNVYMFDSQIRVQLDGGGIGVQLTGILAEIKMIKWCHKFSEKLKQLELENELLERFVDDVTICPTVIPPGWKYIDGKMTFNETQVETDGDERTMEIVQTVANSIDELIKVTFDIPSKYKDKKIPILDVKAGITEDGLIEYKFYKKPIANKYVTDKKAAMSMTQKMHILTQQCFSRLHNTSKSVTTGEKADLLSDFMGELKISGYSECERKNILESAVNTHVKLMHKEARGLRPYYRSKFDAKGVNKKSSQYKRNWFRGNDNMYKTVMFVDATPNDELIKALRRTEEKFMIDQDHRIKFVSKSGTKLINLFQKRDPFQRNCDLSDCAPCAALKDDPSKLSDCKVNNVCYSSVCTNCDEEGKRRVYHGETARNLHIRSREHMQLLRNKSEQSFMYKHVMKEHAGDVANVKFKFQVEKKFKKPLQRQLFEAKCIDRTPALENLNSKDEFNGQTLKTLEVCTTRQFQCKMCGMKAETMKNVDEHVEQFHKRYPCDLCEYVSFGKKDLRQHQQRHT